MNKWTAMNKIKPIQNFLLLEHAKSMLSQNFKNPALTACKILLEVMHALRAGFFSVKSIWGTWRYLWRNGTNFIASSIIRKSEIAFKSTIEMMPSEAISAPVLLFFGMLIAGNSLGKNDEIEGKRTKLARRSMMLVKIACENRDYVKISQNFIWVLSSSLSRLYCCWFLL